MRLLRVEVEHFACIRRASLELGPGLNVLYGPNDLGKSTLAQALRAALLLQHSSSAADSLIAWESGEQPWVRVTFEVGRRFWQVEKRFGPSGVSFLRESNDGVSFTVYKKAREVDEELRTMLAWGIAAPGGAGTPRGLPPSFLSTVLLGEQANVAGVLQATLEADSDESGRSRLTAALEAFAQAPLFKTVLDQAQTRVDTAFTPTGKRKRGQASPFREVTEEVKRMKDYLEQVTRRVAEADDAAKRLEDCQTRLFERTEEQSKAAENLKWLRSLRAQLIAVEEAEQKLAAAQNELAQVEVAITSLSDRELALREASAKLEEVKQESLRRAAQRDAALAAQTESEDALRRARSDDAEKERRLRYGELEKERLELEAKASSLRSELDTIGRARAAEAHLGEVTGLRAEEVAERERLEGAHKAARAQHLEVSQRVEDVDAAERILASRRKKEEVAALQKVQADADADRAGARQKRRQAEELETGLPVGLPSPEELNSLRTIRRDLELAEAKLGGGLSVAVERPSGKVAVDAIVDGARHETQSDGIFTVQGERTVTLSIGDIVRVTVTAGEKSARLAAEALAKRWKAEADPILQRAGAANFETLAERAKAADDGRQQIDELRSGAARLDERASLREMSLTRLPILQGEIAALEVELAKAPTANAEKLLEELGGEPLESVRADLNSQATDVAKKLEGIRNAMNASDVKVSALDERLGAAALAVEGLATGRPDTGWEAAAASLDSDLDTVEQHQTAVVTALAALAAERDSEVERAEANVHAAEVAVARETESLEAITSEAAELQNSVSALEGELKVRRETVAKLDVGVARERVEAARTALNAVPRPDRLIGEEELAGAERMVEQTEGAYQTAKDEARKAEGALETVGGQVVREEEETAQEALRLAEQKERDVDLDYEAWRLLVEKLREAESTEGQHLGEALSIPVSKRFAALTGGRYGKLQLTPQLRTEGVRAAGSLRATTSLSVGTQEQLATLLRLTVAEFLGSVVVLDDHLAQTDPARSRWFVDVLRERADKAQIILLTCRPLDYVREADLPVEETSVTRAGGLIRVVDLARVIMRGESERMAEGQE